MATATMLAARDTATEQRNEQRRLWLGRVDQELETASGAEPEHAPGTLAKHLDQMVEIANKSELLQPVDKIHIRNRVQQTKLGLYQRHLDFLLESAIAAARDADRTADKNELLKLANDAFAACTKLGLPDGARDSIKQRIGIIRETTAAGESARAKEEAEREAQRREISHPREQRTFTRWHDPALTVVIAGRKYATADWSLGGLLIEEYDGPDFRSGEQIEIRVGLSVDRLHREKIEIVRCSPEMRRLALRSRRFASAFMQIKRECDAAALSPV